MKNYLFWLLTLLLSVPCFAQNDFLFFEGTFAQLQTRAINANRPYFVYFYANWSYPCKTFNEQILKDEAVIAYAQQHYLAMRVDGESILDEGKELARRFEVMFYPTVLIFSPEGKLLQKITELPDAQVMMGHLKRHVDTHATPQIAFPEAGPDPVAQPVSRQGEYLFRVSAAPVPRIGHGVQVGVFSSYRNVFKKLLELEGQKFHKNVMVFVHETAKGDLHYKLILGPFPTKLQAESYHAALLKDAYYQGAKVVELSNP